MKSSVAVFSNQGDPFPPEAKHRSRYHPSAPQRLTEAQKQTVLSPDRLRTLPHHLSDALSPPDLSFLGGSQRLRPGLPDSDSFNESWPSTEGSSKTPERDEGSPASSDGMGEKQRPPGEEDSVLARYVARFRSGRPTSRRDRSPPHSGLKAFWWLQESSPEGTEVQRFRPDSGSSAPLESSPHSLERTTILQESSLNDSGLCPEDVDIAGLQLRAGKLIERSESSVSSAGAVSSEGLGSSPASNVSSSECDRMRPPPLDAAPVVPVLRPTLLSTRAQPRLAPEEDILYQWRLRRKMEQAREGALHATTRKRSPSPPVRIPKQVVLTEDAAHPGYRVSPQGAAQSSGAPLQPHYPLPDLSRVPLASPSMTPTSSVPPHLHLLCDILPCAHRQKVPGEPQKEQAAVGHHEDGTGPPAQQPPQRKAAPDRMEDRKMKPKGDKSRRKRDKTGPSAPATSMIHRAMEQVISERLFSPLPSPRDKTEGRQQRPSAPCSEDAADPQPPEIAAHLLEEAEDSDGADFADDPLLQVLRDQRESLRSGLRAVDSRLDELEKRNQ